MKKISILCTAVLLLGAMLFCGCAGNGDSIGNPKTFADENISITLTDKFSEEKGALGFYASYVSKNCGVVIYREGFDGQLGLENVPLSDYINNNEPKELDTETALKTNGELKYWESQSETMYAQLYCFKGTDAFYRVRIFCSPKIVEEFSAYFLDWAKTVSVK